MESSPVSPPPAAAPPSRTGGPGAGAAVLTLVAALLAGGAAFLAGEWNHDRFKPSEEASRQAYDFTRLNAELKAAGTRNNMLVYGTLGGLTGLALGLAGGLARRPARSGVLGALAGLMLGVATVDAAAYLLVPYEYTHRDQGTTDLTLPLMIHAGMWVPIGLAAGFGYGYSRGGLGDGLRCLIGGGVGAVFGTIAYELLGGILFPMDRTVLPIAVSWQPRLLAHLLVPALTAVGILVIGRPPAGGGKPAPAAEV